MFPGTFAHWNERSRELSLPGAKVPGYFHSWEKKFHLEIPGSKKSLNLPHQGLG